MATTKMNLIPLITLRGLVASCAIENAEHEMAIKRIDRLIDRFGPFRTVGSWIIPYLYSQGDKRTKEDSGRGG